MKISASALTAALLGTVVTVLLVIPMMLQWERPPMDSEQLGYRGLGMEQITNPRIAKTIAALNQAPSSSTIPSPTRTSRCWAISTPRSSTG
jgi:hypothetical protein